MTRNLIREFAWHLSLIKLSKLYFNRRKKVAGKTCIKDSQSVSETESSLWIFLKGFYFKHYSCHLEWIELFTILYGLILRWVSIHSVERNGKFNFFSEDPYSKLLVWISIDFLSFIFKYNFFTFTHCHVRVVIKELARIRGLLSAQQCLRWVLFLPLTV